jgi:hypothetical protein
MKTPNNLKAGLLCAALAAPLVLTSGCSDHSDEIVQLEAQLAAQRRQLETSEERWDAERKQLRERLNALESDMGGFQHESLDPFNERVRRLEHVLDVENENAESEPIAARIANLERRLEEVRAEAAQGSGERPSEIDMDRLVDQVADRVIERQYDMAPTKDLAEALARLNISDAERDLIRHEVIDAKRAMLELLDTPTEDGRNLANEIIDMVIRAQSGEGEPNFARVFGDLARYQVPGDAENRTYFEVMEDIKERNRENIGRILTPEDQRRLSMAQEDWTEFEVGEDDPWAALYMERLEELNRDD